MSTREGVSMVPCPFWDGISGPRSLPVVGIPGTRSLLECWYVGVGMSTCILLECILVVDVMSHAELSCCNMFYSNWNPSQTAEGASCTTPVQIGSVSNQSFTITCTYHPTPQQPIRTLCMTHYYFQPI